MYQIVGITHSDNSLAESIDRKFYRIFRRTYFAYYFQEIQFAISFSRKFQPFIFGCFLCNRDS